MKKSSIPLLLAALVLLPAAPRAAQAAGVYIAPRVSTGTVNFRHGTDLWTSGGALAAGYDFHPVLNVPIRAELEYSGLGDVKKTHKEAAGKATATVGASALFVNAYYDWHNSTAFTPYVSLGLGTSLLSTKVKQVNLLTNRTVTWGRQTTTNTAWNIGLGGSLRLSETIALDLGYRYANLGNKAHTKSEGGYRLYVEDVETHQVFLGAKFSF
jgi:opacity protein-like surface antigen